LAILSLIGGYVFDIPHFLEPIFPVSHEAHDVMLEIIGSSAGILGIALAWLMYIAKPGLADSIANSLGAVYRLVYNKYFVDEAYDWTVVKPLIGGSRALLWRVVDAGIIDGTVNGVGTVARGMGGILRRLQSGNIRTYAAWVVLGSVLVIAVIGLSAGGLR
jgi:NADH-quinone oxidoreductase subunit L